MNKFFTLLFVSFFIWVQGGHAEPTNSAGESAADFMKQKGDQVIRVLTNKSISDKERANQFRQMLEDTFNLKAVGKFVLGRYWKQANDADKQKFLSLFKETTVATYATRFKEYTTEKFEILGSRPEADGGVTVLSRIVRPNDQVISIDWKIFEKNGKFLVYDVVLEGISMGITQRSEYASVIQAGGGNIQAIIQALQKKLMSDKP
jgi:phospholipid transport system substrate-binding protein